MRVIENKEPKLWKELQGVYQHRALVFSLAFRELKIKYAQTVLGFFWSLIRPLSYLAIYTFFFTVMMVVDTGDIPYTLVALSGIIGWNYFMDIVHTSGQSLIHDAELIKKNHFPRLILPIYRSLIGTVEFVISLGIFFIIQLVLGHPFQWTIVLIPLIYLMNMLTGLSVAIWTSVLSVRVRDFYHLITTLINFGMWLTPVFYAPNLIPEKFKMLLYINPMAGVIASYRWAMLGDEFPHTYYLIGFSITFILLFTGLKAFVRVQQKITDYL